MGTASMKLSRRQVSLLRQAISALNRILVESTGESYELLSLIETKTAGAMGFIGTPSQRCSRKEDEAWTRFVVMFLAHREFSFSREFLRAHYKMDPGNINHGINRVVDRLSIDPQFAATVWHIKRLIENELKNMQVTSQSVLLRLSGLSKVEEDVPQTQPAPASRSQDQSS